MPGIDGYVKLMLHCDGADTSTIFTDSSGWGLNGHLVTPTNNCFISTSQSQFGGASGFFGGSNDYLTCDTHPDFGFGTADFTIDFWVRLGAFGINHDLFDWRPSGVAGAYPFLYVSSSGSVIYHVNSAPRIISPTSIEDGLFHHVLLARSGTTTKLFLDGLQTGSSWTDSTDYQIATDRPIIGADGFSLGDEALTGWMDEIRISNGIARFTNNFSRPTDPYDLSNFDLSPASSM